MLTQNKYIMNNITKPKLQSSQGELLQQCHYMANVVERDLPTLKKYEITEETLVQFKNATDAYRDLMDDERYKANLARAYEIKKQNKQLLLKQMQYISLRVASLYKTGTADNAFFGAMKYHNAKESDLLRKSRLLLRASTEHLNNLKRRNVRQADLYELETLIATFDQSIADAKLLKTVRSEAKSFRLKQGLALKAQLQEFSIIGKLAWNDQAPALYNDYVLSS